MGTYAPLRATLRSAGIAGWAVGAAGAALTFLFGVATGQAQASLELAAAGAAVGALWIGPMVGAAVGAARTVAAPGRTAHARRGVERTVGVRCGSAVECRRRAGAVVYRSGGRAWDRRSGGGGSGWRDRRARGLARSAGALVAWYSGRSVTGHTGA